MREYVLLQARIKLLYSSSFTLNIIALNKIFPKSSIHLRWLYADVRFLQLTSLTAQAVPTLRLLRDELHRAHLRGARSVYKQTCVGRAELGVDF